MKNLSVKQLLLLIAIILTINVFSQNTHNGGIIPPNLYTNKVIKNGNWSDPSIWENKKLPTLSSIVYIPSSLKVNYDINSSTHLFAINNHGTLEFRPSNGKKIKLIVDTFINSQHSFLNFNASKNTDGSIEIIFKAFDIEKKKKGEISGVLWNNQIKSHFSDGFPVKRLKGSNLFDGPGVLGRYKWDPSQLSLGLITMGKVRVNGKDKTDFLATTGNIAKGSNKIQLIKAPSNWKIGDEIILSGTELSKQSEIFKIKAISGSTITIDGNLKHSHKGIEDANWYSYVGNLTRNIVFTTSESNRDRNHISSRGHVMFMHNPDVIINNAQFFELGRTDKSNLLDDLKFTISNIGKPTARLLLNKDADGNYIYAKAQPDHIENQRGRYGLHFHKTLSGGDGLVKANGNVVWGSPGWAMVHHDSNADFTNNVILKSSGGMIAESGSEIGIWKENLAIDINGLFHKLQTYEGGIPAQLRRDSRKLIDDDFRSGDAFGLQSRAVEMIGNVAADCGIAFHYQADGDEVKGIADLVSTKVFSDRFGYDAFPLEEKVIRSAPPLLLFKDNIGFNCKDGFKSQNRTKVAYTRLFSMVENLTVWNSKRFGIYVSSNFGYLFKDSQIHCSDDGRIGLTEALLAQTHSDNLSFSNVKFYNFPVGVQIQNRPNNTNNNANFEYLFHNVKFYKSISNRTTTPSKPYESFKKADRENNFKVFGTNLPDNSFNFIEKGDRLDKEIDVQNDDFKITISGDVRDRAGTHAFANFSPSYKTPFTFRDYNFENDEKLAQYLKKTSNDSDTANDPVIDKDGNGHAFMTEFISDRLTGEIYRHYFRFNVKGTRYKGDTNQPTEAPIGKIIWIQSKANLRYVTTELRTNNVPLECDRENIGAWEQFEVVATDNGLIALKAKSNEKYVTITPSSNAPLFSNVDSLGDFEKFKWVSLGNQEFAIKSNSNGKYVQATLNKKDAPLMAKGTQIKAWETFIFGIVNLKNQKEKVLSTNSLEVYPNPSQSNISIKGIQKGDEIKVYTILGKLVIKQVAKGQEEILNVSVLESGLYLISVRDKGNIKFMKV